MLSVRHLRYLGPYKKPEERICPVCKLEMEDEYHFCMPRLPEKKKKKFYSITRKMSPNEISMFLINPLTRNMKPKN